MSERGFEGARQLVGARCPFVAATNAFATLNHLFNAHATHQGANALGIAVTTAQKSNVINYAIVHFESDFA
jgi:hypothetical protein